MTTAKATPGRRPNDDPNDDERKEHDRQADPRREEQGSSDELKEAEARRLARMELERATDEGMRPAIPE